MQMSGTILAILLAALFPQLSRAATLVVACSGEVTTRFSPSFADTESKKNISDLYIVIDFDRKAVSGFWANGNGYVWLPITAADANSVSFEATRKYLGNNNRISGNIDRITGVASVSDITNYKTGAPLPRSSYETWLLHCKIESENK